MNKRTRMFLLAAIGASTSVGAIGGCADQEKPYGVERQAAYESPAQRREIWAIAPAVNLSGYQDVDALLQADLLYAQLQQVRGLTIVPVNRVLEVCAALRIAKIQSQEQADLVCDLLGCDALLVPSVTAYDAYMPPKVGASLQLLTKSSGYVRPATGDSRQAAREAARESSQSSPVSPSRTPIVQAVGMFDASNGTTRDALNFYAAGRNDPNGPMGAKEYLVSMDRYCGFVYHELIVELLNGASRRKA